MNELLGYSVDISNYQAAAAFHVQLEQEEAIQSCMAAEGFEYFPEVLSPAQWDRLKVESDRDWTERFGFGISTLAFSRELLPNDLAGFEERPAPIGLAQNDDYVASLTEAEAVQYFLELWGPEIPAGSVHDVDTPPVGCVQIAQASMQGPRLQIADELTTRLEEMWAAIANDTRFRDFEQSIRTCVETTGLPYVWASEIAIHFQTELDAIIQSTQASSMQLDTEAVDQLRELQEHEIAIALATFDCGGDPKSQAELVDSIRQEYEDRFVLENSEFLRD